jgi:hypothetical protein
MRELIRGFTKLGFMGVAGLLLVGCAANPTHRYSGHWVQGEPYSNFIDSHDGRTYLLYDSLPKDVEDYMESQKGYSVANSESGMESAVHLVVEATMADEHTYDPDATPAGTELHITKVISYGPADPAFVESRKSAGQ